MLVPKFWASDAQWASLCPLCTQSCADTTGSTCEVEYYESVVNPSVLNDNFQYLEHTKNSFRYASFQNLASDGKVGLPKSHCVLKVVLTQPEVHVK